MTTNVSSYMLNEQIEKIDELDLSAIKRRLCLPESEGGHYWSEETCKATEIWYKRFLKLKILVPRKIIIPVGDIDEMWHIHILFTRKYHSDCKYIFGYYLHHNPSSGTPEEKEKLRKAYQPTLTLFQKYFGETPQGEPVGCCLVCE